MKSCEGDTKLGNDAQLSPRTVRDYFQVLQDTLIGDLLPPFQRTRTRKAVATENVALNRRLEIRFPPMERRPAAAH